MSELWTEFPEDRHEVADTLVGARVILRPIIPEDHRSLWALAIDPRIRHRWRWRGHTPTIEEFTHSLYVGVLSQFVVSPVGSSEIAGHVVSYSADMVDAYAYVGIIMAPSVQDTGTGVEAMALFVRHLFAAWSLRKVYMEVPEFNMRSFRSITRHIAVEEGRLRQHRYWDGRYYDQILLAIYRESFDAWRARMKRALPYLSG